MSETTATPDPLGELVCSRQGCRAIATWGMLWNNPKIHTPQRRKVWLACDDHRQYLREYLSSRSLLREEVTAAELEGKQQS
ncbi:MAG TPA: hypothetical protein VF299_01065 [Mycobacterium sp.]